MPWTVSVGPLPWMPGRMPLTSPFIQEARVSLRPHPLHQPGDGLFGPPVVAKKRASLGCPPISAASLSVLSGVYVCKPTEVFRSSVQCHGGPPPAFGLKRLASCSASAAVDGRRWYHAAPKRQMRHEHVCALKKTGSRASLVAGIVCKPPL